MQNGDQSLIQRNRSIVLEDTKVERNAKRKYDHAARIT